MTTVTSNHHRMSAEPYIREHLAYLRAAGRATTTIDKTGELLRRFDRELPRGLGRVLPGDLVDLLAGPADDDSDWSPATKALYRAILCGFYRWAVHGPNPCLDADPSVGLVRPQVVPGEPRPAEDHQVAAALARAREPWRLHCLLAGYAGLRCIEIARLDRAEISPDGMLVHGKGGRDRTIPVHPRLWAAVEALPPGPVTRKRSGAGPDAHWVSVSTREHLHRLGVATSLHRFRSWFATRTLDECGDLMVVKELLGHASVATTQVYTRVNQQRRRAAVAGLPELGPSATSPAGGPG